MKTVLLGLVLSLILVFPSSALAHPGRTASDGCHYCRTNCDDWAVAWNVRHCHEGTTTIASQETLERQIQELDNQVKSVKTPPTTTTPKPTIKPTVKPTIKPRPTATATSTASPSPSPQVESATVEVSPTPAPQATVGSTVLGLGVGGVVLGGVWKALKWLAKTTAPKRIA